MRTDRPGYIKREVDYWCTAPIKGRLFFYPPDAPLQVWAVSIQPAGVIWAEAEVRKITECNVMVRYAGETARLDRRGLWLSWARWRGVMFVSSRTGRIAAKLDEIWQDRYGAAGAVRRHADAACHGPAAARASSQCRLHQAIAEALDVRARAETHPGPVTARPRIAKYEAWRACCLGRLENALRGLRRLC